MKKLFVLFVLFFFLLSPIYVSAQTKLLTIDEAVVGMWRELRPESIRGLAFRPETKTFTKIDGTDIKSVSYDLKKENVLISLSEVNQVLKVAGFDELRYFPGYSWASKNEIKFYSGNSIVVFDVVKKAISKSFKCDSEYENATFCAENSSFAYTVENNLFVLTKDGKSINISNDSDKNIVYGQTVHRNEFGIDGGIFWSPDGTNLAFYRKDESKVSNYPIVDVTTRVAEEKPIKYCMAGMDSEEVTLGVYNIASGKTTYLKTEGPKDQYLTSVTWSPDGKFIYVGILNREQNHLKMNRYVASTGAFDKTLFEEKNDRYVEPQHPLSFIPSDPTKFLYWSRKDGYQHLYLYDVNGNQISQVTKGNFEVQEICSFINNGSDIIINANKETPIDFSIYKVNIASGKMNLITTDLGSHYAIVSPDGQYLIDAYSSTTVPYECSLYQISTAKKITTILKSKNPLADYKMGKMSIGTLKANDGVTDLYYRMILPPDFDPNKKYPAIIYVYGGPHLQLITNSWMAGASGWENYMAQKGYVMFSLDNRGSANRGMAFESIVHRQLGKVETQDQLTGLEYLRSLKYVDMNRIGVHGWSFGGFMTTTLMTDQADLFKVGVAGGPVIDWNLYEVMYGERYMDMPQENPEGYENSNLLNKADKLKGRLMIIHGCVDPVVVWQHSLKFVNKCIEKKVLLDYFVYPSHEHNVGGYDRIHLMRTVTRYFEDNL